MTTAVTITEVNPVGNAYQTRIHAAGCRDIRREAARMFDPEITTGTWTPEQWLEFSFGDVAADSVEPGSEGWSDELRAQASEVVVCDCARAAGFHF